MTDTPLDAALTFDKTEAGLTGVVDGHFSNGPISAPPEAGFPFGGLLAAMAARAIQQGLGIKAPLRTLSVQYLAAARFGEPLTFRPRLLRGGRGVSYAALDVEQTTGPRTRATHHATATFGGDAETVDLAQNTVTPPLGLIDTGVEMSGPMSPRFSTHVDYRFDGAPRILGGNSGREVVERVWMRIKGGRPLDEAGLCYLLDALYPPAWTAFDAPPMMTTVDLRYDLLGAPTPETAPDGWAFFEFRMLDLGHGWTVDEATAWGAEGRALALSRQRRRLLG